MRPLTRAGLIRPAPAANLPSMRRASISLLCAVLAACAAGETEDDSRLRPPPPGGEADALVGGGGPPPPGAGAATRLFFRVGQDGFAASSAGTEARVICPGARPVPDAEGGRVLCVPDAEGTPLTLYDLAAGIVIEEYAEWRLTADRPPLLSPDGGKVAVRARRAEDGMDVVRVYDDGGNIVAETPAFEVLAFPGPETVLFEAQQGVSVWALGADPVALSGTTARGVGPDAAGAVYQVVAPAAKVFYADGVSGAPRDLGEGTLLDTFGRRVLIEQGASARIIDVGDPRFEQTLSLPTVPFDRQRSARLEDPDAVLVEVQSFASCPGGVRGRAALETTWRDTLEDETVTVATGDTTHRASVDRAGTWALVLDVDVCGAPMGSGRVVHLKDDSRSRELRDLLAEGETPRGGAISRDGRFVAIAVLDGVRVIDLASDYAVRAAAAGGAGGDLVFR